MADAASDHSSRHIVLVHGTCHGAWSWHRVTTRLRSAGHRVTALDLAASGVDERRFADYNQPLVDVLASFPTRVLLVDHSLGGLNVALTTDKFPDKVAAGVFVTALLPDTLHPPSYVYCKLKLDDPTMPFWLDTRSGDEEKGPLSLLFGPKFMSVLYSRCSPEDSTLAVALARPSSLFVKDLSSTSPLSESGLRLVGEGVRRVCGKDEALPEFSQRWMI
ncbi:putative inactive methylesterase 20 isoform X2 [Zingiber officinale]|uniref:putative inactive methylesterase 20 isoform X2 n=1 Tax=Zingiber officinale TaxID=94328 RepID=UPI001C4D06DA|nr:putative inactive methylesterase 20 isoform X2 [Zingiber officinale]